MFDAIVRPIDDVNSALVMGGIVRNHSPGSILTTENIYFIRENKSINLMKVD
jgi:hypothetical protein